MHKCFYLVFRGTMPWDNFIFFSVPFVQAHTILEKHSVTKFITSICEVLINREWQILFGIASSRNEM